MSSTRSANAAPTRYHAIDYVKFVAILTAIELHSGFGDWSPYFTEVDRVLRTHWGKFLVPAFIMTSGFLYYRPSPIALREVGTRLTRLLVPYTIASGVVMALGFSKIEAWPDVFFKLATGSALGIYYYMYQAALCTPLIWPMSRMRREWVGLLAAALYGYAVAQHVEPEISITIEFFWVPRNPLNYFFAYFVTGWLARAYLPELQRLHERARPALFVLALFGIGLWAVFYEQSAENWIKGLLRATYSLGVVGLISLLTHRAPLPGFVRFISDATLTIYMYHRLFQIPLIPFTKEWDPLVRIAVIFCVGLAGASGVCVLGRRLLGRRSRLLLGS